MIKEVNTMLLPFIPIVKGLSIILGANCEVLLHDVSMPECSVVACENTHVTGRGLGAPMTAFGRQLMQDDEYSSRDGVYNYLAMTEDGKKLKCSVIYIRDTRGRLVGLICVNMDVSKVEYARELLDDFLRTTDQWNGSITRGTAALANTLPSNSNLPRSSVTLQREKFYRELDDVWDHLLQEVRDSFPVPLERLSPTEIQSVIEKLDREGFFLIKGSINVLANELNKSRYTLYGYLRKLRKESKTVAEGCGLK